MMGIIGVLVLVSNIFTIIELLTQAEDGEGASEQRIQPLYSNKNQLSGFVNRDSSYVNAWSSYKSATTVEAIIGAVYRDAGLDAARKAIQRIGVATLINVGGRRVRKRKRKSSPDIGTNH